MKIKQVYHRYEKWEDYHAGMYGLVPVGEAMDLAKLAAELLGQPIALKAAMKRAVTEWPVAAEVNMTNLDSNRRAWLGAAACCIQHHVPEYLTRIGWNSLNQYQQNRANAVATQIIEEWETAYVSKAVKIVQIELFRAS
jgi:hypothetical protein